MKKMDLYLQGCMLCIVLCMTSVPVASQTTMGPPPRSFSDVFMDCIREKNLPAINFESEILTVLYTLTQSESIFDSFSDCMAAKKTTNRLSSESTMWYMARVFDKDYMKMFWPVYDIIHKSSHDISCVTNTGELDRLEQCLTNVTAGIQHLHAGHANNLNQLTDDQFKKSACGMFEQSPATFTSPTQCLRALNVSMCPMHFSQFLMSYVMMVSCNTSHQGATTEIVSPTPLPTAYPQPSPVPHPTDIAFFTCLNIIYPGRNFTMLFPPSEITLSMIRDIDQAQAQHERDIDDFCGNVTQYSDCVKVKLVQPKSLIDSMIKLYVDVDNLGQTLGDYCTNKQVVKANFKCAYRSTMSDSSCNGGMNEVITTAINVNPAQVWTLCNRFKKERECRVQKQLTPCNTTFASAMNDILEGVLNDKCRAGELIFPENDLTDLLPCFATHMLGIVDRLPQYFGNPNKKPNFFDIYDFFLGEVGEMCKKRDTIFSCVSRTLRTSTKKMDVMITQMFSVENIIKILGYNCDMLPELKAHGKCLITNMGFNMQNFTGCISVSAGNITALNATSATAAKEQICGGMGSILHCYDLILDGCHKDLVFKFKELVRGFGESCNNPTYSLQFNAISASSMATAGPLVAASLLTLIVN